MSLSVDSQVITGDMAALERPDSSQPRVALRPLLAHVTIEHVIWGSLILLAALTRFWELGDKALHHDESLHAYYSYKWATGGIYEHDPLMHGPLLFFLNAFVYIIFGATDATSRYAPAFTGILIVAMPWFLRKPQFLGRWGALATSALLLISPTILYQSRYIRHDVYTVAGVFMMFICLMRYIDKPERKWLVTLGITTAMMLANHEIIVANIFIFGSFLYAALLLERLRSWWPTARDLVLSIIGLHIFAVAAMAGLALFMPSTYKDRFLNIPWDRDGTDSLPPTRTNQFNYYQDMATNWLIVGLVVIAVGFVVALVYLMRSHKRLSRTNEGWLDTAPDNTVASSLRAIAQDSRGVLLMFGLFLFTFVFLFTSIFTNWYGIFTSTVATDGTFLYWLGQHDVRRGDQPWFYFLVMLPQYEFLPITIGAGLAVLSAWRGLRLLVTGEGGGRNLMFRLCLGYWFFLIFAVLSWAGEKMPWLIVHITLPGTILAGIVVGRTIERGLELAAEKKLGRIDAVLSGGMVLAVVAWFLLAARLTYGNFNGDCPANSAAQFGCRQPDAADLDHWWLLIIPPSLFLLALGFGVIRRGWRTTALVGLAAAILVLGLLELRVAWRLSYTNPDVPVEMMVYTQTSPDLKQAVNEANQLSLLLAPDGDGEVLFDTTGLAWPLWWYFRDNPLAISTGTTVLPQDTNAAVLFLPISTGNSPENAEVLANYTGVEHPFRWHFPEEIYRFFALAPELPMGRSAWISVDQPHGPLDVIRSVIDSSASVFSAQGQTDAFRIVVYRDLNDLVGYYPFQLYIRNDLLPEFGQIRY